MMKFQESGTVLPCVVRRLGLVVGVSLVTSLAFAQVPPNIEAGLRNIGPIVDPGCTAKLYRPLMPKNDITSDANPLYPGITVVRNQSFGSNPYDVVDVFTADKGPAARTVLIYLAGGGGDKIELQDKEANAFYDNIGRWAAHNGMVGVNMQRHFSPTWDGGAKDISSMIQWVEANISKYHGNPDRMFIWAHSAANMPLGTYVGRPELYGPKGLGVKGVIFMSGAPFDIAPAPAPQMDAAAAQQMMQMMSRAGKACGQAGGLASTAGALPGVQPGQPGGPALARAGAGGPPGAGRAPIDPALQLTRSSLPALQKTTARIMVANGELDIGAHGGLMPFNKALKDALCAAGPDRCPTVVIFKGESHMSEVFSIGTSDKTVSGPVLAFIRKTK